MINSKYGKHHRTGIVIASLCNNSPLEIPPPSFEMKFLEQNDSISVHSLTTNNLQTASSDDGDEKTNLKGQNALEVTTRRQVTDRDSKRKQDDQTEISKKPI